MTEYCRLCANLKYSDEIVTSIDNDEHSMEQKLRACCQWTTEIIENRLPHSVCAICLDELNKSWSFSQSVQLAQRRLLEIFETEIIETKPLATEIHPSIYDSSEFSNDFPFASNIQNDGFNQQSKSKHKCAICSQEFYTAAGFNTHRQQGCEGLIEIEPNIADYKPSEVDFREFESDMEASVNQMTDDDDDDDDDDSSSDMDEQPIKRKIIANQNERMKSSQNKKRSSRKSLTNLKQHGLLHSTKSFECQLCDHKPFASYHSLQRHLVVHVNNSNGELQIDETNNKTRIIQRSGGDPIDLDLKVYNCTDCDRIYDRKENLKAHLIRHAEKNVINGYKQMSKEPFKCPLCGNTYSRKLYLCEHLVTHAIKSKGELKIEKVNTKTKKPIFRIVRASGDGDPIYIPGKVDLQNCEQCDRVFATKDLLDKHRASHTNERPFECCLCHKAFKTQNCLRAHSKIHVPNSIKRNWICELCGRAFKSTMELTTHMQTSHSNERPYKCEICGSGFKNKFYLKNHHSTHSKEKKFKCNQCDKTFRANYSLKKHLEIHSGVIAKPHVCEFCGIGFRSNNELKDHRSMHTGEKRFRCEHCGSNFGARSSFYSHMRKVHGISLLALKKEKLKK